MPMYTLGHDFVPPPVHAGGLRYHGDAPMVCGLVKAGRIEARAYKQNETFEAAVRFARSEGIIPAPEPAHAIRAVIEEADAAREAGEERDDPVRPLRPRQLRSRRLRRLPGRRARGPGVLRGGAAGRARRAAGGARDRLNRSPWRQAPPLPSAADAPVPSCRGSPGDARSAARPRVGARAQSQPAPDKDAAVILVVDASKSMKADDGSGRPKMAAAKEALNTLVDELPDDAKVGLRVYGSRGLRHRQGGGLRGHEARLAGGAARPRRAEGGDRRDHAARLHADRALAAGRGEGPRDARSRRPSCSSPTAATTARRRRRAGWRGSSPRAAWR